MMRQQKKAIVRLILAVFLVMVLCYGPNLFSQEMKPDTVSIEKKEFELGEDIRIDYRCSEDNLPYLWIGIFNPDVDDQMMRDAGLSIKILGELNASVLLNAPATPGNYQVRLFSMQSGEVSVHRRLDIEVFPLRINTGFKRRVDGFQILNYKSRWVRNEGCAPFVVFAKYYFEKKGDGLFNKYMGNNFGEKIFRGEKEFYIVEGKKQTHVNGQHIIAALTNFIIDQNTVLITDQNTFPQNTFVLKKELEEDKKNFYAIVRELYNSKKPRPVVIGLYKYRYFLWLRYISGAHAVLAFAYERKNEDCIISVYDPNFPVAQKIIYNHKEERFDDYETYSEHILVRVNDGNHLLRENEDSCKIEVIDAVELETIFKETENTINRSAEINIKPISDKDEVCLPIVTIKGMVKKTVNKMVNKTLIPIDIYFKNISIYKKIKDSCPGEKKDGYCKYSSDIEGGKFSIDKITLDEGKNTLYFATMGKNFRNNKTTEILNNYEKEGNFVLNYKPPTIAASPSPGDTKTEITFEIEKPGDDKKLYTSPSFKAKWDFGDGSSSPWVDWSASKTEQHKYENADSYKVTLQVRDDDNEIAEATKTIEVKNDPPPSTNCPKLEYVITPLSEKMREGSINRSLNQTASEGYKLISGLLGSGTFVKEENNNTIYPVEVLKTRRGVDIERMNQYANDHWVALNGLFLLYMIQDKDAPIYEYTNLGNLDNVSKHDLMQYKNYLPGGKIIDLLNEAGSKGWELVIISGNAVCRRIKNDPVKYKYMSFIFNRDNIEEFKKLGEEGWQYCTSPTSQTGQTGQLPVILKQRVGMGDSFHLEVVIKKIANSITHAKSLKQMEDANAERAVILQEHGKKGWLYKGRIEFGKASSDGTTELFIFQVPKNCR